MIKFITTAIGATAMVGSGAALAEVGAPGAPASSADVHSSSSPPAQSGGQSPEAGASAEGTTQVAITPQDIDNFAKAVMKVNKIQADTSLDQTQKQAAMTAAVQESNLDPFKFNTIAEASKTNPELQQRVQMALNEQRKPE